MSPSIDTTAIAGLSLSSPMPSPATKESKKDKKSKSDKKEKKEKKSKSEKSEKKHKRKHASSSGSDESADEADSSEEVQRPSKKVHTKDASDAAVAPAPAAEAKKEEAANELSIDSFPLSESTKAALRSRGIEALFPIQASTLRPILDGLDVLGRARTGTGKTLAFSLPMIELML
ncbi:hypothetical protein H4R26_006014, partial [Coemansia thaxteri]